MPETAEPLTITAEDLAEHWGVSERRLRDLAKEGVAVRARGGFDLRESDRRYIAKLRTHDESRKLRAALIRRQTQRQEVRLHQDAGALLTRSEAQRQCDEWWGAAWNAMQGAVSRLFYALPGDEAGRRATCWRVYNDIRGELLLHRQRIAGVFLAPEVPRDLDRHLERLGINGHDPEE
jgi:hypothetical protein